MAAAVSTQCLLLHYCVKMLLARSDITTYHLFPGCATTVLVTGAGFGEMTLQLLVGSVSAEGKAGNHGELHSRGWSKTRICNSSWRICLQGNVGGRH